MQRHEPTSAGWSTASGSFATGSGASGLNSAELQDLLSEGIADAAALDNLDQSVADLSQLRAMTLPAGARLVAATGTPTAFALVRERHHQVDRHLRTHRLAAAALVSGWRRTPHLRLGMTRCMRPVAGRRRRTCGSGAERRNPVPPAPASICPGSADGRRGATLRPGVCRVRPGSAPVSRAANTARECANARGRYFGAISPPTDAPGP